MGKKKTAIITIRVKDLRKSFSNPAHERTFESLSEKSAQSVARRAEHILDAERLSSEDLRVQINTRS